MAISISSRKNGRFFSVLPIRGKLSALLSGGGIPIREAIGGAYGQREGAILTFSDTFLTPRAPKMETFGKILGKIGLSDAFFSAAGAEKN